MIQYYLDLAKQVSTIQEIDLVDGQIQKIYSTAFYVCLTIRARGKTRYLYLGRGAGHEGIWLHDSSPEPQLRKKDNFLEYLRRHLSSCSFKGILIDQHDRIIRLDYQKFGQTQSILWFWKGRKLYFVHYFTTSPDDPHRLLLSWKNRASIPNVDIRDLYSFFDEVGRTTGMKHDIQSPQNLSMDKLLAEEMMASTLTTVSSGQAFLRRKRDNILEDLRKARQWEKLQQLLDKKESLDQMYELKVDDQKIRFESELNSYERRDLVYQKIKKLKRGERILADRLALVEDELSGKEQKKIPQSTLSIVKPVWGEEKQPKTLVKEKSTGLEYKVITIHGVQFGVGLNAHGNDQLRNKWASKTDHWIHLDGAPSTHVIVKLAPSETLNPDLLNVAASIVAHFSHFNGDWVPIIHTQVKNLKGVSGAPGMVIYKKEKHLRCPRVSLDGDIED
jgi:predicted ribosome quality control (RQC) complex YloA/Tae2 family protein